MPWCPKCGAEYYEGIKRCYDCEVDLVDKEPDMEEIKKRERKEKGHMEVVYTLDEVLLDSITDIVKYSYVTILLEQEGILYRMVEEGIGQYMEMLGNILGKSIYIDRKDYKRAKEILDSYVPEEVPPEAYNVPDDIDEEEYEDED
jgi:hypothetical protein